MASSLFSLLVVAVAATAIGLLATAETSSVRPAESRLIDPAALIQCNSSTTTDCSESERLSIRLSLPKPQRFKQSGLTRLVGTCRSKLTCRKRTSECEFGRRTELWHDRARVPEESECCVLGRAVGKCKQHTNPKLVFVTYPGAETGQVLFNGEKSAAGWICETHKAGQQTSATTDDRPADFYDADGKRLGRNAE